MQPLSKKERKRNAIVHSMSSAVSIKNDYRELSTGETLLFSMIMKMTVQLIYTAKKPS